MGLLKQTSVYTIILLVMKDMSVPVREDTTNSVILLQKKK